MRTTARQVVGSGDEERDPASRATELRRIAAAASTVLSPAFVGTPVHSSGTRLTLTLGGGPRARDRHRLCVKHISHTIL